MGHVKTDIDKKARVYEVKYALNSAAGVKKLLRDRHYVSSARFNGDMDASAILIDLHSALNSAGLTERETETIAWVSGADLTQKEAADIMRITQPAVSQAYESACAKIAAVYERWNYGEIVVGYEAAAEDNEEGAAA